MDTYSFSGDWGSRDKQYRSDPDVPEYFINYLNIGKSRFQLTPSEGNLFWTDRDEPNYRGHTFQLWTDSGLPTPYFLNYHHDERSGDFGSAQKGIQEAIGGGAFLKPPTAAPTPMFKNYYPNSGLPYGAGPFDARTSRGGSPYQQLDRDLHYYTIDKPTYHYKHGDGLGGLNKYRHADNALWVQTTPRPEAMDPVQNAVLRGDNPKSRLITSGESKVARLVESKATAVAQIPPKDEL